MRNMIRVLLVVLVATIVTLDCSVDIIFLREIPRLGHNNYSDNYFSCRAVGSELQWIINGVPTDVYSAGSVAKVYTNTTPDFNFTTTVLSSKLTPQGEQQFTFDSVLIVSCYNKCNLNVVCTNGLLPETFMNQNILSSVVNKTNNSNIHIEHILTQRNIIREPRNTSIFVCGVNNNYMTWHINGNTYGFTTSERIGNELKTLQEHDASTVNYQAILIGMEPYRIVTVMFVVDNSEVSITCGYDQIELQLSTRQNIAVSTDTPMTEDNLNQSEKIVTTLLNPMTTEDMKEPPMSYTVIIIAVASSLGGLIIILCFLTISIHTIRASIYRKTEGDRETSCGDINIKCRSLLKDCHCCCFPKNNMTLRSPDCMAHNYQNQESSLVENQNHIRTNNDTQQSESSPVNETSNLTESPQSSSPPIVNSGEGGSNVQSNTSPTVTTTTTTTTSGSNIPSNTSPTGTTTSGFNVQPNTSPTGTTSSGSNIQPNTSSTGTTTTSGACIQPNTPPLTVAKTSGSMQHSSSPSSGCESTESNTSHSVTAETSPTEFEDADEIAEIQPGIETSIHQSAQQSAPSLTSDEELVLKCKPAQNILLMPPMLQYDDHAESRTLQLPTDSTLTDEFVKISSRELQIIMLLRDKARFKKEKIDEPASSETEDHKDLIGRFRTLSEVEDLPVQSKKSSPVLTLGLQDKDEQVD